MRNGHVATVDCGSTKEDRTSFGWDTKNFLVLLLLLLPFLNGCAGFVGGKQQSSATSFNISPLTVNFGKVAVGQKSSQTVTITNSDKVAHTILRALFSSTQFTLSGLTMPATVNAGQSANVTIWMNGTAAGPASGTLTIQGDAGSTSNVVQLTGSTTATSQPTVSLSVPSIDFGTVSVGSKVTNNLSISNNGTANLILSIVTLNGAEFSVTGITTPLTISPGQSAVTSVTFSPTSAGSVTGGITIMSNDPVSPTVSVALTGSGTNSLLGQLTANPTSLSFGSVGTGNSASQSILLTNSGNATVHLSSIVASGAGFSVTGLVTPAQLVAGQTATISVKFAPIATGNLTGSILLTSDASGSPLKISLSGTGAQAGLSVSPASFNFGSVVDGQTKSQLFTLTNTGTAALTVTEIATTGAGYSASGLTTPVTIAVGKTATFSVLFAPTTAGTISGSVTIASDTTNSPSVVALSGGGIAASVAISASPLNLSFGNINLGSSGSRSLTLTNSGNSNMTLSAITVNAKDVTASGMSTPVALAPGKSAVMNLTFSPKIAETVTGNVTVTSSGGSSAVIPLTGSGVQAGLTITPASASFGTVTVGAPNSQTIQLSNSGTAVLTVTQLSVTGSGFSSSSLNLPLSLNPGATSTFNIQFAPQAPGAVSGSVSIVSNAPSSPSSIPLSGSGVAAATTISLSAANLSFGSLNTGTSATQNVTITDTGNSNVTLTGIAITGTGFTLSGTGTPVTLSPSQKLTMGVQFSPSAAGVVTGSVTITSNATGSPAHVTLSGTGVASTPSSVALTWDASTSTVSGYNVYRSTVSGSGYSRINSSLVPSLTYTDSNVVSAQTYYYVTTAVDSSGDESSYSNQATAVIP